MINVSTNIQAVINAKVAQLKELQANPMPILKTVAMAVLPVMKYRVHVSGLDSSGSAIGTYSKEYMLVRTGNYKNAVTYKKGANAGTPKTKKKAGEAGTYTKGTDLKIYGTIIEESTKVGLNRPVYNRSEDPKVVLSLTRQMENDLNIIPLPNGYGIGYLNPLNFQKAKWCEATYKKPILSKLTESEEKLAVDTAQQFTPAYVISAYKLTPEQYLGK